jgi:hypothetical protein
MGKYPIIRTLAAKTAASAGGTSIYELPEKGKISGIIVQLTADCVSGYTNALEDARLIDRYSKIEVIANGSHDLHTYTGQIAQAMDFYDTGRTPWDKYIEYASGMQRAFIPIHFGRYMGDPDLALDCSQYDSLELKLTNDITSTVFANLAEKVYYWKHGGDDVAVGTKGVLRKREWRKWTTVADEWKYLDLPEEEMLRRIDIQCIPDRTSNVDKCDFRDLGYDIQYKAQTGDVTMFDQDLATLLWMNADEYAHELLTGGIAARASGDAFQAGLGMQIAHGTFLTGTAADATTPVPTRGGDDDGSVVMATSIGDRSLSWLCKGLGIFHTAVFRHDRLPNMADLLDLAAEKVVQLNIHTRNSSNAAGGTDRVVLETVVPK